MARSSKPRRPYESQAAEFELILTQGGGAELVELGEEDDDVVWTSVEDVDFREEFPDFLTPADVHDILDYLEEIGELTTREADRCNVSEEFLDPSQLTGLLPRVG